MFLHPVPLPRLLSFITSVFLPLPYFSNPQGLMPAVGDASVVEVNMMPIPRSENVLFNYTSKNLRLGG